MIRYAGLVGFLALVAQTGCTSSTPGDQEVPDDAYSPTSRQRNHRQRVVATVNGTPILERDLQHFAIDKGDDISAQDVLDDVIDHVVLAQEASRRGYDNTDQAKWERKKSLTFAWLFHLGSSVTPHTISERKRREYYENHIGDYTHSGQITAIHALVRPRLAGGDESAKALANEIATAAKGVSTMKAFRTRVKEATKGKKGVKIETLPRFSDTGSTLDKTFVNQVFSIPFPRKRLSPAFKTRFGYHVVFIESKTPPQDISFDAVSDDIAREMVDEERKRIVSRRVSSVINKGEVFIFEGELDAYSQLFVVDEP